MLSLPHPLLAILQASLGERAWMLKDTMCWLCVLCEASVGDDGAAPPLLDKKKNDWQLPDCATYDTQHYSACPHLEALVDERGELPSGCRPS